jgi:hypothetical protein
MTTVEQSTTCSAIPIHCRLVSSSVEDPAEDGDEGGGGGDDERGVATSGPRG